MGQLVQASKKTQANSAEDFRDGDIIDAEQRKHHFKKLLLLLLMGNFKNYA